LGDLLGSDTVDGEAVRRFENCICDFARSWLHCPARECAVRQGVHVSELPGFEILAVAKTIHDAHPLSD